MATAIFRTGDRPLLHLGLLGLTACTTFLGYHALFGTLSADGLQSAKAVQDAAQFSFALLLILGSHEMGHYLYARRHGVDTTLPYFIPTPPYIGIGTLGAVIRIRSRIPTLNALVDIGASGPLAGLIVALPVLVLGLAHSTVAPVPDLSLGLPREYSAIGVAGALIGWLGEVITGVPAAAGPEPTRILTVFGDSLLVKALTWTVHGPLPAGHDVMAHPLVIAGWFGLLVTTLNLVPIGQLDGGHLAYAVFGRRAPLVGRLAAIGLLVLALFWSITWIVWLLVATKFVGYDHPEVSDPSVPVSRGRKAVCLLCLVALALCLMPVPMTTVFIP